MSVASISSALLMVFSIRVPMFLFAMEISLASVENGLTVSMRPWHEGMNVNLFIQHPHTIALRSVSLSGFTLTAWSVVSALMSLQQAITLPRLRIS